MIEYIGCFVILVSKCFMLGKFHSSCSMCVCVCGEGGGGGMCVCVYTRVYMFIMFIAL